MSCKSQISFSITQTKNLQNFHFSWIIFSKIWQFWNHQHRWYLSISLSRVKWLKLSDERTKFCELCAYTLKLKIIIKIFFTLFFFSFPTLHSRYKICHWLFHLVLKIDLLFSGIFIQTNLSKLPVVSPNITRCSSLTHLNTKQIL